MTEDHAYIVRGDDGVEYGPVSLAELRDWVRENRVGLGTDVRPAAADGNWHPWHFYPELVALLAEVRVTGALPSATVLAPMGRRFAAFLLDLIMSFVLVVVLWWTIYWFLPADLLVRMILYTQAILQGVTPPAQPVPPAWFEIWANIILLGVPVLYYTGFHAAHGRTPAKSICHLQVTDAQGRKPTFGKALVRALIFVISVYFLYGIPLLYAFFHPQRRGLHDLVAGTYVVEL